MMKNMQTLFKFSFQDKKIIEDFEYRKQIKIESIIDDLIQKGESFNSDNKKANTKKLLKHINTILFPEYTEFENNYKKISELFNKNNITLNTHNSLEEKKHNISFNIKDFEDIEKAVDFFSKNKDEIKKYLDMRKDEYIRRK